MRRKLKYISGISLLYKKTTFSTLDKKVAKKKDFGHPIMAQIFIPYGIRAWTYRFSNILPNIIFVMGTTFLH